jgi:phosphoglycerol transferase MdoB-like AlkP superfamily enzyme
LQWQSVGVSSTAVKEKSNLAPAVLMMVAFALTRWPGLLPENFSAAYALVFCAGVYFPGRLAWWLPLATMLTTDALMNIWYYRVAPVSTYMLVSYATYAAIIAIGRGFSTKTSWIKLVSGGLLGAILFYLVTNTAAWLQNPAYAKTIAGWIQALTTGVPGFPPTWVFFWRTLLSSGLFTGLFAGAMKFSEKMESTPEKEAAESEPSDEAEDSHEPSPEESKA